MVPYVKDWHTKEENLNTENIMKVWKGYTTEDVSLF